MSMVDTGEKGLWALRAETNFVNNLIGTTGFPATSVLQDQFSFTTALTFAFTEDFKITVGRKYDLIDKDLTSHIYTINWMIHCWEANFSWSKRSDGAEEIFFAMNISAVPRFRVSKPSSAALNYNQLLGM